MKKLLTLLMLAGVFTFTTVQVYAQDSTEMDSTEMDSMDSTNVDESFANESINEDTTEDSTVAMDDTEEEAPVNEGFHSVVKKQFLAGGPAFMGIVLICLILGLAISIERIITLNLSTTNTKKLLEDVEKALASGGVDAAKEVTKHTRGPVASIFTQGMMRMDEGIEMVEKSIIAYGSVEMGRLEKGMVWISLFISLAPMLGFMGTVIGMIEAFDAIAEAGDVNPALVANGIKVALLTTVGGLIVAVILQLFYNYLVAKIDSIVNSMEDASISLVDILVKNKG